MFPVRCRIMHGLGMTVMPYQQSGNAVVLMPGAGYNLQSLPGYVGNNPPMVVASAKSVFEQPQQPVQQQVIIPRRPEDVYHMPPPPPPMNTWGVVGMGGKGQGTYWTIREGQGNLTREQASAEAQRRNTAGRTTTITPPPVVPPVQPPPVQPPSNYEAAQQAYAAAQAQQQQAPAAEQTEVPKTSSTATAVSIGAAGILAALLFK